MKNVTKVMLVSMATNIFLSVLKVIVGIIGKSSALVADGIHSFSDLSTDVVAVIGNHISRKPADKEHPYGHGKAEYITSILISLVILGLGFTIIYNSVLKEVVVPSLIVVFVSLITIVSKFMLSSYIIKKGEVYQNQILIASGYESRTDVISSVVVLLSALLMQFTSVWGGFGYADMIASVIVGILIVRIGFSILKENLSIILGEQETNAEYLKKLKQIMLKHDQIKMVDAMTILKYGSYYKFIAEVSVDSNLTILEAHKYIHEVENTLKDYDQRIRYVTIHINPYKKIDYVLKKATKEDKKLLQRYLRETTIRNQKLSKKELHQIDEENALKLEKHLEDYQLIWYQQQRIGCIGYYREKACYLLDVIYVEPDYQGLKIGSELLEKLLQKVYREKKSLMLWVYKDNYSALNLYERFGFQIKEETETRYLLEYHV